METARSFSGNSDLRRETINCHPTFEVWCCVDPWEWFQSAVTVDTKIGAKFGLRPPLQMYQISLKWMFQTNEHLSFFEGCEQNSAVNGAPL